MNREGVYERIRVFFTLNAKSEHELLGSVQLSVRSKIPDRLKFLVCVFEANETMPAIVIFICHNKPKCETDGAIPGFRPCMKEQEWGDVHFFFIFFIIQLY
jgi:hypothetical protein